MLEIGVVAVFGAALVVGAIWLFPLVSATLLFSLTIAAEIFSGQNQLLSLPIGPERLLMAATLLRVLIYERDAIANFGRFKIHYAMAALCCYLAVSMLFAGTLFSSTGFFALLDRVGVFPFIGFIFAPVLFKTRSQRLILAGNMAAVGLYLSATAVFEMTGLSQFVFPHYIVDPTVGIHWGRARGPFLESTADGLGLLAGGVGAAVMFFMVRSKLRFLFVPIVFLTIVGMFLTLTRSIWICAVLSPIVFLVLDKRTRKSVIPVIGGAAALVIIALLTVPTLQSKVSERSDAQGPLWDRLNTNTAAIQAFEQHPLFGIGFDQFQFKSGEYLRQSGADYPLTGIGLPVHNVFLGRFAELGAVGGFLWIFTLVTVIGGCLIRVSSGDLVWKRAFCSFGISYLVVAMLAPLSGAMPNLLLWTLAGAIYGRRAEPNETVEVIDLREIERQQRALAR